MLLGVGLLYVGAVLCLNGLWLLGLIEDHEIVVVNVVSGFVTLFISLFWAFGPGADATSIKGAALTLLFTATYGWVAHNRWVKVDGRGLGWFSLFVAITVTPVAIETLMNAHSTIDYWMGLNWIGWGVTWFFYWVLLTLKKPVLKFTGALTAVVGALTGWLPGVLILLGHMAA